LKNSNSSKAPSLNQKIPRKLEPHPTSEKCRNSISTPPVKIPKARKTRKIETERLARTLGTKKKDSMKNHYNGQK
jgi:DNA-binding transcriptional regulator YiaG